ncbi:hypothetical protein HNP84_004366 [Thermocatellispora tengchongensis]|uniref:DUF6895 domain-containing protein n=1 Tax=Thermocatellispora tengchongensis TaxID=1073253 RepID=A0A840P0A0_9ACTN|nr:hypothetical protein [Thermocatellispora tengchongensis]MBB5134634.1 hypothetical protein [Thermocatellispora tengchongensis]
MAGEIVRDTERPGTGAGTIAEPGPPTGDAGDGGDATAELARLSAGATRWISENVDYLDPSYPDLPVTPKVKASLELALLHLFWSRVRPGDDDLARVTETLHKIWRDPEFPRQVAAKPAYFRQYGLIYGALAPAGITGGHHLATLAELAPGGHLAPYGKSPYLRLETRYYADIAGLGHAFESYRELYEASFLANLTTVLPMDIEDAYTITHTVFHLTDFGFRDAGLTDEERERALGIADRLTDHFVEADHWDLTGEFVLTQFCLGADPARTRSGIGGIRSLLAAQTPSGAIPGRFAAQRPGPSATPVELFRKSYHTTLVAALASMIILSGRAGAC